MTNSNDATTGNKRKLDDDDQSNPGKAQKVDNKVQTTLDDAVTRQVLKLPSAPPLPNADPFSITNSDKNDGPGNTSSDAKKGKQHDAPPPEPERDTGPSDGEDKTSQHETAVEPHGRDGATPSNILEKGTGRTAPITSSNGELPR